MKTDFKIASELLVMRSMELDDAEAVFNYRSDAITNKYQGWIPTSIDEMHEFIKNKISPVIDIPETWYQMVMIKKSNDEK